MNCRIGREAKAATSGAMRRGEQVVCYHREQFGSEDPAIVLAGSNGMNLVPRICELLKVVTGW